ncbi:MAG: type II CAAX endopeptidase family protein [Vicinamibacterales bacterium]
MSEPIARPDTAPLASSGPSAPEGLHAPTRRSEDPVLQRLGAVVEVLLCSGIPTQLAIGAALRAAGWQASDAAGHLDLAFVLMLSVGDTFVLIALMTWLLRARGESAAALWLGQRPVTREFLVGLMTVPAVIIVVGIMLNTLRLFAPGLHNVTANPLEQLAATPGEAATFALVAILAGGVREELQRAFLLHRFEQHLGGARLGVIVISVAFGLGHYVQGWDAAITTGLLGAFWALVFLRRRSSVAPVVSHATFNSLEILRVAFGGG